MPQTAPKTDTSTFREIRSAHEAGAPSAKRRGGVGVSSAGVKEVKPFLKWAGGKRQLLPALREHLPLEFGRYYEPFVGGGAVFFDLVARRGVFDAKLGDNNQLLVAAYLGVRDRVEEVIRLLSGMRYDRKKYYALRSQKDLFASGSTEEFAARFIYFNRAGFNGLWRVNKNGRFNVPFGRYTNPTICDADGLRAASAALQEVTVSAGDFERSVTRAKPGDLVYFDPPYVPLGGTSDFTAYTKDGFTLRDQERLHDLAFTLKRSGVRVVLSNSDTPAVRDLYRRGWKLHPIQARRNINSKASKRGAVGELIIT